MYVNVRLHGQWQGEVVERIEPHRLVPTHLTAHFWLQLTMEQVYDDRFVSQDMILPCLWTVLQCYKTIFKLNHVEIHEIPVLPEAASPTTFMLRSFQGSWDNGCRGTLHFLIAIKSGQTITGNRHQYNNRHGIKFLLDQHRLALTERKTPFPGAMFFNTVRLAEKSFRQEF